MANIRNLKENNGDVFYPLTHERAVRDSNGVSLDTKLAGLESKSYVEAWNGTSTPVVANIPAGVTVTYNTTTYTGTLAASADTVGKTYLVKNGNDYDRYITSQSGNTYSWVPNGSTGMDLSGYATDAELNEVSKKVANINVVGQQTSDEVLEFQTDGGGFIAKVSPNGVEAIDVKVRVGSDSVSLTGIYKDGSDTRDDSLSIGDNNKKNIVQFERGHIITKYFNSQSVIEDIEDLKNGGSTGVIDDKTQRKMAFKEDYYSYKYGKANSAWFERLRIMHYSDTHRNITNLKEALGLAQGIVHLVVDTGDNANGIASTTAANTISELNDYVAAEGEANTTPMPMLICTGNHDVPNLTKKQYFDIMCSLVAETNPSFVFGDATNYRTYGYVDITPNATIGTVRVISLDPFDYDDGQFMNPYGTSGSGGWMNCVFSQKQIDWLIATLRSAANNGYKVITAMHYSWGDNPLFVDSGSANPDANYHQDPFMIPDIINAMQNRSSLSKSYPDDENINNITVNEDFSGLTNPLDFVCHLFGHIHSENEYQCQKTDGSKFYDILMVGAPNMGSLGYAINKVHLQPNTINSIKCTVLEIDTVEKNIYRVNYGAYKAFDMSITERTKKIHYRFNQ